MLCETWSYSYRTGKNCTFLNTEHRLSVRHKWVQVLEMLVFYLGYLSQDPDLTGCLLIVSGPNHSTVLKNVAVHGAFYEHFDYLKKNK